jgi:hypothetical protein
VSHLSFFWKSPNLPWTWFFEWENHLQMVDKKNCQVPEPTWWTSENRNCNIISYIYISLITYHNIISCLIICMFKRMPPIRNRYNTKRFWVLLYLILVGRNWPILFSRNWHHLDFRAMWLMTLKRNPITSEIPINSPSNHCFLLFFMYCPPVN